VTVRFSVITEKPTDHPSFERFRLEVSNPS